MTATPVTDPDEERWARAEELLDGVPSEGARRRRRRTIFVMWTLIVAVVLCAAIGFLVAVKLPSSGDMEPARVSPWRSDVAFAFNVAGILIECASIFLWVKSGAPDRWRSPSSVLTRRQRRLLLRWVLGKAPLDGRRVRLARDAAKRLVSSRVTVLLYVGLILIFVAQGLSHRGWGWTCWSLALTSLYVVLLVMVERYARLGRRFLRAHPSTAGDESDIR